MVNIQRTGNTPIIIVFEDDLDTIQDFVISYFDDNNYPRLIKQWFKKDTLINQNIAIISLTQQDTLSFPKGIGHLEIKWFDKYGFVIFDGQQPIKIRGGNDITLLKKDSYNFEELDLQSIGLEEIPTFMKNRIIKVGYDELGNCQCNPYTANKLETLQQDIEKIYAILEGFGDTQKVKDYIDSQLQSGTGTGQCSCDLSNYATKTELTSTISNLATKNELNEITNTLGSTYATKSYVEAAIDDIEMSSGECQCNLENYVTKDELDEKLEEIPTSSIAIQEKIEEYCKDKNLATKKYVDDTINASFYEYEEVQQNNDVINLILNGGDSDLSTLDDNDEMINVVFNGGKVNGF